METDRILQLAQKTLDQFDDRPLEVSIRRAIRLAVLLGETETAIYFAQQIRPLGGSKEANIEDIKKLMADPTENQRIGGPSSKAIARYVDDRLGKDGKVSAHTVSEAEYISAQFDAEATRPDYIETLEIMESRRSMREVIERCSARTFSALCGWERQLTFRATHEQIFTDHQRRVDTLLMASAPDIMDSFSAVYRRLRDAARLSEQDAKEELSQAVTTCRRILKAVADSLLPPQVGAVGKEGDGEYRLNDPAYINRVREFIKKQTSSSTYADAVEADFTGILKRFPALNALASQGVHASIAASEAKQCALNTYIVAGELLGLAKTK